MTNSNSIAQWLQTRLGVRDAETLLALERLAGRSPGHSKILADMTELQAALEPSMPLFCLPIGRETFTAGLHLRPRDLTAGRFAVMRCDDSQDCIEVAGSMRQFIFRALAEEQAFGNEEGKPMRSFAASVEAANAVFGKDFYIPGRYGKLQSDGVEELMIETFGGTPLAMRNRGVYGDTKQEQLAAFEKGIEIEPGCLAMYAGAVGLLIAAGERQRAARLLARSLECYHHTAYDTNIVKYLDLGCKLRKEFPSEFPAEAAWTLDDPDPRQRARVAASLFKSGQIEHADKILNDVCYGIGDYDGALEVFRKHYEKLGWDWALALCELRGS